MANPLHPIWFRLPKRFYQKLELFAETIGRSPEETLEYSLDLFGKFLAAAQADDIDAMDFVDRHWQLLRALRKDAEANQVSSRAALEDAVKLFHVYGPLSTPMPKHGGPAIRKSPAALAVLRWAKVSPEERSRRGRELALKRWGAKKGTLPRVVGEDQKE